MFAGTVGGEKCGDGWHEARSHSHNGTEEDAAISITR